MKNYAKPKRELNILTVDMFIDFTEGNLQYKLSSAETFEWLEVKTSLIAFWWWFYGDRRINWNTKYPNLSHQSTVAYGKHEVINIYGTHKKINDQYRLDNASSIKAEKLVNGICARNQYDIYNPGHM